MATFKKLADRVRAFNRDEKGAAGSIEQVGGVAVAVLILLAVLQMMLGQNGDGGLLGDVSNGMDKLVNEGNVTEVTPNFGI